MAITTYTTPDEVRAVLGVAPEELEDATILLPIYETQLIEDIYDLGPTLAADYATIKAGAQTPQTTRFVNLVNTWACYDLAQQLLPATPMFAPKTITSDKDTAQRVEDPYALLQERIDSAMSRFEERILALYAILMPGNPAPVPIDRVMVVDVGLSVDPITG